MTLEDLKALMRAGGYRFESDADGTERMFRPDGSLAMIATRGPAIIPANSLKVGDVLHVELTGSVVVEDEE